jgi:hypothetical protein
VLGSYPEPGRAGHTAYWHTVGLARDATYLVLATAHGPPHGGSRIPAPRGTLTFTCAHQAAVDGAGPA